TGCCARLRTPPRRSRFQLLFSWWLSQTKPLWLSTAALWGQKYSFSLGSALYLIVPWANRAASICVSTALQSQRQGDPEPGAEFGLTGAWALRVCTAARMLRWLIGGGREPQGLAEKSPLQSIGEEQTQNPYTELLVLKAHHDIVRFLVQLDECRQEKNFWNLMDTLKR
uniref:WD repeat domain 41 n=1 Tax=Neovison vison TaxID=452646 RepID=A0A8C7A9U3_NEOVI